MIMNKKTAKCLSDFAVFLFDFDQNIYGKTVRVDLLEFQRAEQKFDSIEALRAQMEHDKKTAQTNLKGARL